MYYINQFNFCKKRCWKSFNYKDSFMVPLFADQFSQWFKTRKFTPNF